MAGVYPYNVMEPSVGQLVPQDTRIMWGFRGVANNLIADGGFRDITINDNNELPYEYYLLSRSDERYYLPPPIDHSCILNARFNSVNDFVSPVVDLRRLQAVLVGNKINNLWSGEDEPHNGHARARYVAKPIELNQTSEDLQVYLTGYRPQGTNIKVYAKLQHVEDVFPFREHIWIEMGTLTQQLYSSLSDKLDFKEFTYTLPDLYMTGENGEFEYKNLEGIKFTGFNVFSIKIVLLSPDTSLIPRIKNLRGICLQI